MNKEMAQAFGESAEWYIRQIQTRAYNFRMYFFPDYARMAAIRAWHYASDCQCKKFQP